MRGLARTGTRRTEPARQGSPHAPLPAPAALAAPATPAAAKRLRPAAGGTARRGTRRVRWRSTRSLRLPERGFRRRRDLLAPLRRQRRSDLRSGPARAAQPGLPADRRQAGCGQRQQELPAARRSACADRLQRRVHQRARQRRAGDGLRQRHRGPLHAEEEPELGQRRASPPSARCRSRSARTRIRWSRSPARRSPPAPSTTASSP
jgi:hypothetical protein